MFVESCDFCQEFASFQTWLSAILAQEGLEERILIRRNNVISLVGLGPLVSGYVLILPVEHYYSIGQLPENLLVEVTSQKKWIVEALIQEYGSAICFEHGALSTDKRGGACVDHAHIHIIPGCQKFREYISTDFEEMAISGLEDLKQLIMDQVPYLYVEDIDSRSYAYKLPDQIPSQYLRQVWAKALNRPDEWDWALLSNYHLMKETYSLLKNKLRPT